MFKSKLILWALLVVFIAQSFSVNAGMTIDDNSDIQELSSDEYMTKRVPLRIPFRWGIVKIFFFSFLFILFFNKFLKIGKRSEEKQSYVKDLLDYIKAKNLQKQSDRLNKRFFGLEDFDGNKRLRIPFRWGK